MFLVFRLFRLPVPMANAIKPKPVLHPDGKRNKTKVVFHYSGFIQMADARKPMLFCYPDGKRKKTYVFLIRSYSDGKRKKKPSFLFIRMANIATITTSEFVVEFHFICFAIRFQKAKQAKQAKLTKQAKQAKR